MTEFHDFITCPHCGDVDYETTDYPRSLRHDGDEVEVECANCEKPMRVALCMEFSYRTRPVSPSPAGTP